MENVLKPVQLWGGAANISLPTRMTDASDIRPVPDNQEVFVDSGTGQALVIEIVEPLNLPRGEGSAAFCFQDLAEVSGAQVKELHSQTWGNAALPGLSDLDFIEVVSGVHTVPEQGSRAEHDIQVMMAVIRLQASNGDIVLTLSTPQAGTATKALPAPDSAASENTPDEQAQLFEAVCKTLRFEDRSLLS